MARNHPNTPIESLPSPGHEAGVLKTRSGSSLARTDLDSSRPSASHAPAAIVDTEVGLHANVLADRPVSSTSKIFIRDCENPNKLNQSYGATRRRPMGGSGTPAPPVEEKSMAGKPPRGNHREGLGGIGASGASGTPKILPGKARRNPSRTVVTESTRNRRCATMSRSLLYFAAAAAHEGWLVKPTTYMRHEIWGGSTRTPSLRSNATSKNIHKRSNLWPVFKP